MTDVAASEHELAQFLEATQTQELKTWERERTKSELESLVMRRLSGLDGVELQYVDCAKKKPSRQEYPAPCEGLFTFDFGSTGWTRTTDLRLMSPAL